MLANRQRVELTVRVPRGAAGDVEAGVRDVLATVEGVERVEVRDLHGVRPDALDLYVDASVAVDFGDAVEAPGECLRDGFGVLEVHLEVA